MVTKISALSVALLATAGVASASTFYIGSYGTANGGKNPGFSKQGTATTYNGGATYDLQTGGVWHDPIQMGGVTSSWVGINPGDGPSGGHHEPSSTTVPYVYHSYFSTSGYTGQEYGLLAVLADDTVTVKLNGMTVLDASNPAFNHTCNDATPNCTMVAYADLLSSMFKSSGMNDLEFDVFQTNDYATGLDFAATINTTPEPSSLLLLGTGLVGSAGALLRRMRA